MFLTGHSEREYVERLRQITRYGYVMKNSGEFVLMEAIGMAFELFNANERLEQSERQYRLVFENMTNGFALHELICDDEGDPADYRFLAVNPAFERMTGIRAADVIGSRVRELLPNLEPYWMETYARVTKTGEPVSFENYSAELDRHYEVSAFRPMAGHLAVIVSEVTERRRSTEALAELEPTSIRRWEEMVHPDDLASARDEIDRHFCGETDYHEAEIRMRHRDGEWIWILDRGKVAGWDVDGVPNWMFGTHQDVTATKRLPEQRDREIQERTNLMRELSRRVEGQPDADLVAPESQARVTWTARRSPGRQGTGADRPIIL